MRFAHECAQGNGEGRTERAEGRDLRARGRRLAVRPEAEALLRERDERRGASGIARPRNFAALAADVDAVLETAFAVDLVDPGLQALLAAGLLGGARLVARLHEHDSLPARAHEVGELCGAQACRIS